MESIGLDSIDRYAGVWTYRGTRCTSVAGIFQHLLGKIVAFGIHLLAQTDDVQGAGHGTEVATFATLRIHHNCSFDFSHNAFFCFCESLLIIHLFIVKVEDINHHPTCLGCGRMGVEVDGLLIVVEGLLPVALLAVDIAA